MLKFAFLINVAGVTPETYSAVYENKERYHLIAGVDGMEAGKAYVNDLVEAGFTSIDLCGDFDDGTTAQMQEAAGENVKIRHASYSIDELVKLNQINSFRHYGVIVLMRGAEKMHETVLRSDACDTRVIFVKDLPQAKHAAKRLVEKRVNFIELCSWFDRLRMDSVISAIDDAVPVGTCGDLNMEDLMD